MKTLGDLAIVVHILYQMVLIMSFIYNGHSVIIFRDIYEIFLRFFYIKLNKIEVDLNV